MQGAEAGGAGAAATIACESADWSATAPQWLRQAEVSAEDCLTQAERGEAQSLSSENPGAPVALAVLVSRVATTQAPQFSSTCSAYGLTQTTVWTVLQACGVAAAEGSAGPVLWLSVLEKFVATTTAAKWQDLEPGGTVGVCEGWCDGFAVLQRQPFVLLSAIIKEAVAGNEHWLVRPERGRACCDREEDIRQDIRRLGLEERRRACCDRP